MIDLTDLNNNNNDDTIKQGSYIIDLVSPKAEPHQRIKKDPEPHKSYFDELLIDLGEDGANIIMIDDEFDDTLVESVDLVNADTKKIDKLFGTETLMTEFNNINNVIMNDPENVGKPNMEIVMCPICEDRMPRVELSDHLDGCNGITVKINPRHRGANKQPLPFYKKKVIPSTESDRRLKLSSDERELLRQAGYTQQQIDRMSAETKEAQEYNDRIMDEIASDSRRRRRHQVSTIATDVETVDLDDEIGATIDSSTKKHICPICDVSIDVDLLNQHLDECLKS